MFIFLVLIFLLPAMGQTNLDHYIIKFKYQPLSMPPKREALYELGLALFNDQNLSGKKNISCSSCHSVDGFSADTLPLGLGEGAFGTGKNRMQKDGLIITRHTQSLYNVGHPSRRMFFWDARVNRTRRGILTTPEPKFNGENPELKEIVDTFESPLAVQTIFPLTNPEEMLGKESKLTRVEAWDLVMKKIFEGTQKYEYEKLFRKAYPEVKSYNIAHAGNALAELIRHHFAATETPWDLYLRGNKTILTERMKNGAVLFNSKARCVFCHNGDLFASQTLHNIGVPQLGADDKGSGSYRFKVPALRNVAITAPYMHSGVFKTLREVVEHYDDPVASLREFKWNPIHPQYDGPLNLDNDPVNNDNRERTLSRSLTRNLNLNQDEKDDLICFLTVALTDISLQNELLKQGVVNEISDCSPRSHK